MKNTRRNFKNQQGFNLIELMIVIAIIALLIGIGIPAYQSMVKSGNETSAIQSIQNIKSLQVSYAAKHQGKFAPTFDDLRKSVDLDERFSGSEPVVNGYVFKLSVVESSSSTPSKYIITADPQTGSGTRYFYFDSTLGTTKSSEEGPASDKDPSI